MYTVNVMPHLNLQVAYFKDRTLNDLSEFEGKYPSIERFTAIPCRVLSDRISAPNVSAVTVELWENDIAWASYRPAGQGSRCASAW